MLRLYLRSWWEWACLGSDRCEHRGLREQLRLPCISANVTKCASDCQVSGAFWQVIAGCISQNGDGRKVRCFSLHFAFYLVGQTLFFTWCNNFQCIIKCAILNGWKIATLPGRRICVAWKSLPRSRSILCTSLPATRSCPCSSGWSRGCSRWWRMGWWCC